MEGLVFIELLTTLDYFELDIEAFDLIYFDLTLGGCTFDFVL